MKVTPIRTEIVRPFQMDLETLLAESLPTVPENSVLAVTSKVISLCEGNVIDPASVSRDELIEKEADSFLPKSGNPYNIYLTIKGNLLTPNAGIDESNAGGYYVLWPKDPQASAEHCWRYIGQRYHVRNVGVIITDSTPAPLKWGVGGVCIAHCGFAAVNDRVGSTDLFGRSLKMTKINVADGLAAAAVLCMGETNEQTPLALVEDLSLVQFQQEPPTDQELSALHIDLQDDLFGQILASVRWQSR